jgi:hypothetical protein
MDADFATTFEGLSKLLAEEPLEDSTRSRPNTHGTAGPCNIGPTGIFPNVHIPAPKGVYMRHLRCIDILLRSRFCRRFDFSSAVRLWPLCHIVVQPCNYSTIRVLPSCNKRKNCHVLRCKLTYHHAVLQAVMMRMKFGVTKKAQTASMTSYVTENMRQSTVLCTDRQSRQRTHIWVWIPWARTPRPPHVRISS